MPLLEHSVSTFCRTNRATKTLGSALLNAGAVRYAEYIGLSRFNGVGEHDDTRGCGHDYAGQPLVVLWRIFGPGLHHHVGDTDLLHPQLKEMLDDWITNHRPTGLRSQRLLLEHNRPINSLRVSSALSRLSHEAGIGHVTAHQLRHTLATQAINRGMSIDAIAAEEYFKVTEKVETLYGQPRQLPHDDEGSAMHRRMLGNGHCARPVETDCHFESICASCTLLRHDHRIQAHPASPTRRPSGQGPSRPTENLRRTPRMPRPRSLMTRP